MQKVRMFQSLAVLTVVLMLILVDFGVVEPVAIFGVVLKPSPIPPPGIFTPRQVAILAGASLMVMGAVVGFCRAQATRIVEGTRTQLERRRVQKLEAHLRCSTVGGGRMPLNLIVIHLRGHRVVLIRLSCKRYKRIKKRRKPRPHRRLIP